MGISQLARRLAPPAMLVGLVLSAVGCVDYGATRLCETDDDCYLGQTCDLGQGLCVPLACVPACSGRDCGDDGCGGSCGHCPVDEECGEDGQCHGNYPCCGTRECGPDPCAGVSCGTCAIGEACNPAGRCSGDTPCCGTRECGLDPCMGTSCGNCQAGAWCDASGICVWDCRPDCAGKECGSDGCFGSCGACGADEWCDPSGLCRWDCYPDCAGKECGPDGCGGSCGTCGADEWCDPSGLCRWDCYPDCAGRECGGDGCGGSCGTCGADEWCNDLGICIWGCQPDCAGRECGPDGCGGTCGTCAPGEVCDATARCVLQGTQQAGEPCDFDTVNVGTGACVSGLYCLGVLPDPSGEACTTTADCFDYLDPLWNADCLGGFCGASFCSPECENGACDAGFVPQDVSGLCLCIPYWQDPDQGLPGSPCAWDQVNPEAGSCMASLACLGIPPEPLEAPCPAGQEDCLAYFPAVWNPDCVDGGCGVSFCSARCDPTGACEAGFEPIDIAGDCYCIPSDPTPQAKIAYVSNRSGRYEVWVMNEDGSGQHQLTFEASDATQRMGAHSPRWSPDGTRIAFLYGAGDPTPDHTRTMVIDADGTDLREVSSASRTYWERISWSRDGTEILQELDLFMNSQILAIDLATGATRVLLDDTPDGYLIAVSPDVNPVDATLAYIAYNTGGDWGGLRARAYAGGAEIVLVGPGTAVSAPKWSPAGDAIVYGLEDGGADTFHVLYPGIAPQAITIQPPTGSRPVDMDWTATGFVFSLTQGDGHEIWICDEDGGGARALLADGWYNKHPDWLAAPALPPAPSHR